MSDGDKWLAAGIGLIVVLLFNFVPTIIAYGRRHPERQAIAQLNILSLLSFLLWAALLAWAIGGARNDSVIGRFVGKPGERGRLIALVAVLVGAGVATTAYALTQI